MYICYAKLLCKLIAEVRNKKNQKKKKQRKQKIEKKMYFKKYFHIKCFMLFYDGTDVVFHLNMKSQICALFLMYIAHADKYIKVYR